MYKKVFILTIIPLTFMACSRTHQITYLSSPPGAVITCDNKRLGYAPITKEYTLTDTEKKIELPSCHSKWISGAEATINQKTIIVGSRINSASQYLFQRPEYPDYDKDETFALEHKKVRALEKRNAITEEIIEEERYRYYDGYNYGNGYYNDGYIERDLRDEHHHRGTARMTLP